MLSEEDILKLIMRHAPKKGRILEVGCKHCDIAIALTSVVIGYVKKTSGKPKGKIHELHVLDRTKNIIYGIDNSKLAITNAKKKIASFKKYFLQRYESRKAGFFRMIFSSWYTLSERCMKQTQRSL